MLIKIVCEMGGYLLITNNSVTSSTDQVFVNVFCIYYTLDRGFCD